MIWPYLAIPAGINKIWPAWANSIPAVFGYSDHNWQFCPSSAIPAIFCCFGHIRLLRPDLANLAVPPANLAIMKERKESDKTFLWPRQCLLSQSVLVSQPFYSTSYHSFMMGEGCTIAQEQHKDLSHSFTLIFCARTAKSTSLLLFLPFLVASTHLL